jgi:hypothetical protein
VRRTSDRITFFVDRSLGSVDVAAALRTAGLTVEIHDDHFQQDTPDTDWLTAVGARQWVVLTKDSRIRRHPLEMEALLSSGVAAFILTASGLTGREMATAIVDAMPKIERLITKQVRPFVATISRSGDVTLKAGGGRRSAVKRD